MLTDEQKEELNKLFYDPSIGLLSPYVFATKMKLKGFKKKDVIEWVKQQGIDQIYSVKKKKNYHSIIGKIGDYQADTMFLKQYAKNNKGFIGLINFIDITSRKAYGYPIKSTKASEAEEVFKKFYDDCNEKIQRLTTDNGSEFLGEFKKYVSTLKITHTFNVAGDHTTMGKIERFNRTIRDKINKYLKQNKTTTWINDIKKLYHNYNNTIHSSIKMTPNEANKSDNEMNKIIITERTKSENADLDNFNLKAGDRVRVLKTKSLFDKGTEYWSSGLYTIEEQIKNRFKVRNKHNELVNKTYKAYELKKINNVDQQPTKKQKPEPTRRQVKSAYDVERLHKKENKLLESVFTNKVTEAPREKRQTKTPKKYDE
jgi:hypothetical protein